MSWGIKAFCHDIVLNQKTAHVLGELGYQTAAFTHGPHVSESARERVRGYLSDATKTAGGIVKTGRLSVGGQQHLPAGDQLRLPGHGHLVTQRADAE